MKIPVLQENGVWKMEEKEMYKSDHDQALLFLFVDIANQLRQINECVRTADKSKREKVE